MADQTSTNTQAAALPGVPSSWPGAFGAYKHSKPAVKLNLVTLVVLWLVTILAGGLAESVFQNGGSSLINLIVGALTSAALALTFIAGVRGQRLAIGEAFSKAFPFWLRAIGLDILVGLSLLASLLLLVIPFFFVFPRLILATYFLVDKNLGVIDAYKASWNATKGNTGKIWGIIGVHFLIVLLMITIIGIPFAIYFFIMYSGVFGVLYEFLNKAQPASAPVPAKSAAPAAPVV
ncbi:MAG TPA: hypothetical protein VD706_03030 [Candidatus Saccharimonadales bacterium]|nr:hypothetical protein [Candidatus Saccharimonadales bacterium]